MGITVIQATDINGQDVTALFEPAQSAIDLQPPLPEVSIEVEPSFIIEGGETQAFWF